MNEPTSLDRRSAQHVLPRPYVMTWGVLASIAATYLALAIFAPDIVGLSQQSNQSQSAAAGIESPENQTLRDLQNRLAQAQLQLAKMGARVEQAERAVNTSAQLQIAQATEPANAQENPVATIQTINATRDGNAGDNAPPSEADIAQAQLRETESSTTKPVPSLIETGSIQIPPPPSRAPAPPIQTIQVIGTSQASPATSLIQPVTAASPTTPVQTARAQITPNENPKMGVRVATGPSVDALRLEWNQILKRAGPEMAGLEPIVVQSNQTGTIGQAFDLIAGPLKTLSDAQRICNAATVQRSVCEIRRLGQQAIANL